MDLAQLAKIIKTYIEKVVSNSKFKETPGASYILRQIMSLPTTKRLVKTTLSNKEIVKLSFIIFFMFKGDDIDKKVSVLSGGEKTRLAMVKLLLEPVNLLILDEPTNHLDLKSKDVLKEALLNFDGTLILVSHDRDFLQGLSQKVFEFKDQRVIEHFETIDDFLVRNRIENLKQIDLKK